MGVAPLKSNLLEMFFQFLLGVMSSEGNFLKLIRGKYADFLPGLFEIFYFSHWCNQRKLRPNSLLVQPMFIKFDSSSNHESHQDVIPSSYLTHLHTQSFRKISQVVIFKLSSFDSSPPLKPVTGEFLNDHKMSYTHPNSILSVTMGYRR